MWHWDVVFAARTKAGLLFQLVFRFVAAEVIRSLVGALARNASDLDYSSANAISRRMLK